MNVKKSISLTGLAAILFAAGALCPVSPTALCEDAVPAPAPAIPEGTVTNLIRDPFWPVGYWPRPKTPPPAVTNQPPQVEPVAAKTNETPKVVEQPDAPPKWPDLKVIGFFGPLPNGKHMATIEGIGNVQAGETILKQEGKYEYSWKVNSVSAATKRVSCTRLNFRKIK